MEGQNNEIHQVFESGTQIQEEYQSDQQQNDESIQGKVYDYEAQIPIYALSFSNRQFLDKNREQNILMGIGSYMPNYNKI